MKSPTLLFQVEEKDGKPQAKVLARPLLPEAWTIENFKADAKGMQFDIKFARGTLAVKAYAPKADAKNKDVRGTIMFGNRIMLAQFAKTDDKELTQEDAVSETEEGKKLAEARSATADDEANSRQR